MTISAIKLISDTDMKALEGKIASYIAEGHPVDDMKFSTVETKDGILYSVALMLVPDDSSAQV